MVSAQIEEDYVYLVEDDKDIRESLMDFLESEGFVVFGASEGQQALDFLRQVNKLPRLILLDLMMPGKDGFQFRQEQKEDVRLSQIPIVVMSADGQIKQKMAKIGDCDYLKKPLDIDILLETVTKYFALS